MIVGSGGGRGFRRGGGVARGVALACGVTFLARFSAGVFTTFVAGVGDGVTSMAFARGAVARARTGGVGVGGIMLVRCVSVVCAAWSAFF